MTLRLVPRSRSFLLEKVLKLYFDHSEKFLDVTLQNILLRRYEADSTYDLTLDNLDDLINYMENKIRKAGMI